MPTIKILFIEDNDQELKVLRDSVELYKDERKREIDVKAVKTLEEASTALDNTFDGAIIDLKLGPEGGEGNKIIQQIKDNNYRIPIIILTGTPDAVDQPKKLISVHKKGDPDSLYTNFFDKIFEIYNAGVTRIFGGKGEIERTLFKVFQDNIIPQISTWIKYGDADAAKTEKALLRYTLNHMFQLLDADEETCFPEEMYLYPPHKNDIQTGSIIQENKTQNWFVVINPSCDLVIRKTGEIKADRIILIEIEKSENVINSAVPEIMKKDKRKNIIENILKNNHNLYHHWLPETDFFQGGFLNFRLVTTCAPPELKERFSNPSLQIAPSFIKDVVSRFSSFYSRQGQPDINVVNFISKYSEK